MGRMTQTILEWYSVLDTVPYKYCWIQKAFYDDTETYWALRESGRMLLHTEIANVRVSGWIV